MWRSHPRYTAEAARWEKKKLGLPPDFDVYGSFIPYGPARLAPQFSAGDMRVRMVPDREDVFIRPPIPTNRPRVPTVTEQYRPQMFRPSELRGGRIYEGLGPSNTAPTTLTRKRPRLIPLTKPKPAKSPKPEAAAKPSPSNVEEYKEDGVKKSVEFEPIDDNEAEDEADLADTQAENLAPDVYDDWLVPDEQVEYRPAEYVPDYSYLKKNIEPLGRNLAPLDPRSIKDSPPVLVDPTGETSPETLRRLSQYQMDPEKIKKLGFRIVRKDEMDEQQQYEERMKKIRDLQDKVLAETIDTREKAKDLLKDIEDIKDKADAEIEDDDEPEMRSSSSSTFAARVEGGAKGPGTAIVIRPWYEVTDVKRTKSGGLRYGKRGRTFIPGMGTRREKGVLRGRIQRALAYAQAARVSASFFDKAAEAAGIREAKKELGIEDEPQKSTNNVPAFGRSGPPIRDRKPWWLRGRR